MSNRNKQFDHFLKLVIVGESSVGKSCLLLRFADDQFSENHMATIGVDFRFKTVKVGSKNIKLQIWDTAGQQKFRTITNTYYKNAHAVIFVYDITNLDSFESLKSYWLDEVENYADPGTQLVLVGNKSDKRDDQVVTTEMAEQFAKEKNMLFFQTSAKTAEHVNESFMGVTEQLSKKLGSSTGQKQMGGKRVTVNSQNQSANKGQGGGCCY